MGLLPAARWWLRRLALGVLVLWGAATLAFAGLHLLPGDPAQLIAGQGAANGASPQVLALISRQYGFGLPLTDQYGRFLGQLLQGRLGTSYQLGQPVSALIFGQLWATVSLALGAAVAGFGLALVLALSTAARPRARAVSATVELAFVSTPGFWTGILLLIAFSFRLHWFPVLGGDGARSLVLPCVTLALPIAGTLALVMRDGLERALEQPFAVTVRARGASPARLRFRHALRHALLPALTLSGWTLGQLIGGTVVVETVFARAGIGQVAVAAVSNRDYPVVTGVVLTVTAAFVIINTAIDALYRVIDPRLRAVPR